MKRIKTLAVSIIGLLIAAASSQASLTYVNEAAGNGEPSLDTIMTHVYGAYYTRIDDSVDQVWDLISPTGTASLDAIYAGNSQALYTTDLSGNNSAGPIISYGGNQGYIASGTVTGIISPNVNPFLFMDNSPNTSTTYWSSDPSLNSDLLDHMVTFAITGGADAGDYVIAFEDLPYGQSDLDYNDFVVQVSGVKPVPEASTMIAGALLLLPLGVSTLRILRRNRMA
jgi:Domain of unknown function (DUF4114)